MADQQTFLSALLRFQQQQQQFHPKLLTQNNFLQQQVPNIFSEVNHAQTEENISKETNSQQESCGDDENDNVNEQDREENSYAAQSLETLNPLKQNSEAISCVYEVDIFIEEV